MDERDQEFLERQMRGCQPPPPGNVAQTLVGAVPFVFGKFAICSHRTDRIRSVIQLAAYVERV
jgi:hypothetical protein